MKLYTEEQVKDLNYWKNNAEEDYLTTPISVLRYISELEKLTPIELPSDEEIQDKAKDIYPINVGGNMWMANRDEVNKGYIQEGFTDGAKWVIEQIKQKYIGH